MAAVLRRGALIVAGHDHVTGQPCCLPDGLLVERTADEMCLDLGHPPGQRRCLADGHSGSADALGVEVERDCAVENRVVERGSGEADESSCEVAGIGRQQQLGHHHRPVAPLRLIELDERHQLIGSVEAAHLGIEHEQHRYQVGQPSPGHVAPNGGCVAQCRRPDLCKREWQHATGKLAEDRVSKHLGQRGGGPDHDRAVAPLDVRQRKSRQIHERRHPGRRVQHEISTAAHQPGATAVLDHQPICLDNVGRPDIVLHSGSGHQGLHAPHTTLVASERVTDRRT